MHGGNSFTGNHGLENLQVMSSCLGSSPNPLWWCHHTRHFAHLTSLAPHAKGQIPENKPRIFAVCVHLITVQLLQRESTKHVFSINNKFYVLQFCRVRCYFLKSECFLLPHVNSVRQDERTVKTCKLKFNKNHPSCSRVKRWNSIKVIKTSKTVKLAQKQNL